MLLLTASLDSVMYFLMGGNAADGARSRRPGTRPRLDEPLPCKDLIKQVRDCAERFVDFLQGWANPESDSSKLLTAMGVGEANRGEEEALRFARRQCLGFSAGLFRRFVVRLSAPEYQLWVIADGSIEEPMCRAVAESFLRQRPCCLGYFGRRLRQFLPDVASMLSPLGRATIASWLRTMV